MQRQKDWKTKSKQDLKTERRKDKMAERGGTAGQGRWGQVITICDLLFWMMQLWPLISVCGIKEALMSGRIEEMSGRVELNPWSGVSWETRGQRPVARSRSAGEEHCHHGAARRAQRPAGGGEAAGCGGGGGGQAGGGEGHDCCAGSLSRVQEHLVRDTGTVVSSKPLHIKRISSESLFLQGCLDDWPRSSTSDPPALHRPPRLLGPQVPNHCEDSGGNMASLGPLVFMEYTCSFHIKLNKKPLGGGFSWSRGRPLVATRRGSNPSEKARLRQQVSKSIKKSRRIRFYGLTCWSYMYNVHITCC